MDDAKVRKVSDGIKRAYDALKGALGEESLVDENGINIMLLITQRLMTAELGRDPTGPELGAMAAVVNAQLKGDKS